MPEITRDLDLEITVLSPLHIGSGAELLQGYDVVAHDGRTWRIDEDALLDAALGGGETFDEALVGRPAFELLRPDDYEGHPEFFRYVMEGTPAAGTRGARVSEQIKDVFDCPYLPGSSLKGALRTVLFWGIHRAEGRQPDLGRMKRSRSWASQPLEQQIFGRDPNHDWLRALRVRDSEPLDPGEHLTLQTVRVYSTPSSRSEGIPVDVEAVKPDSVFHTTITLETYGFDDPEAARLRWQGKRRWMQDLTDLGKQHAEARLQTEMRHFERINGPGHTRGFYRAIADLREGLPDHTFLLQVGWGAGWESKTLGSSMLRRSDHAFEQLLDRYRMTRERNRHTGDPFPRTRQLALVGGRPALPMGWVAVRVAGLDAIEVAEPPEPDEAAAGQRTGQLKKFFADSGYGFIEPEGGGKDIFVHVSGLAESAATLREGQRLAFDVEQTAKGPRAVNVRLIE